VLFAVLVDFDTLLCSAESLPVFVEHLHSVFGALDDVCELHNAYKIETVVMHTSIDILVALTVVLGG
jgi:hypothetical protein